jgi:hypothetical protein
MKNLELLGTKEYDFNIGKYLSQGTELFKKDIGGFIVATILVFVMSFIPFCGILGLGNFYKICKKVDEGEKVSVGDIFDFTDFVMYLKVFLLIFAVVLVAMIPVQLSLIPVIFAARATEGSVSGAGNALFAGGNGTLGNTDPDSDLCHFGIYVFCAAPDFAVQNDKCKRSVHAFLENCQKKLLPDLFILHSSGNHFPAWNYSMRNRNTVFHTFGNLHEVCGL